MSKSVGFERNLNELEDIVNQLEKGDLSLEDALKHYEKGIGLARKCQAALKTYETKINELQQNAKSDNEPSQDE